MGRSDFEKLPTIVYGSVMRAASLASNGLKWASIRAQPQDSLTARTLGRDCKAKLTPVFYLVAVLFAFVDPRIAGVLYLLVVLFRLFPDRRIERVVGN